MDISNTLISVPIFSGTLFVVAGLLLWSFPPKDNRRWYGYKSSSSMKSPERWDFAQRYAGKESLKIGFFLIATCILGFAFEFSSTVSLIIAIALVIIALAILILRTEKALDKKFGD